VDAALPLVERIADFLVVEPDLPLPLGRVVHAIGCEVPVPEPDAAGAGRAPQPVLALAERRFHAPALGDVAHE
jgi:hypothetical protein